MAEKLLPVVNGLYAAVANPAGWTAAMEAVTDLLRGTHTMLWMGTGSSSEATDLVSARVDCQEFARRQATYEGKDPPGAWLPPVNTAMTRDAFINDRDYARNTHYNEVVRPFGGFHALYIRAQQPGTSYMLISCRPENRSNFQRDDLARLQLLGPHLLNATALRNRLGPIDTHGAALAGVLDHLRIALVLVDAAGSPVFVNQAAQRITTENSGVHLRDDGLAAATAPETRSLREAIAAVCTGWAADGRRVRLGYASRQRPVLATILPMTRLGLALSGCRAPHAAIFLTEAETAGVIDHPAVIEAFGLTPRETEVVALLAEGLSLDAIAERLHLGRGTVSSHVKRVFDKTDTHSQAALAALIGRFTNPLA